MERLYSKIIGMSVFVPNSMRPINTVQDIVIDPETGKVIAFAMDTRGKKVVVAMDVISVKHGLLIRDADDIIDSEDVLRVQSVLEKSGGFMHKSVETEEGERLGKVVDMAIDDRNLVLIKLYVSKTFIGIVQYDSRIISAKNIVEVRETRVIVKSGGEVRVEEAERVQQKSPA
jgi:uncharacterized protein YrrD